MEQKLKIYILGNDRTLLNKVISKVNTSRPVEASLYTDLKEFLSVTMTAPPDLFGVSMDYPHPKIGRFPKVFNMAMNIPVIIFGETSESNSRKAVSIAQADYKINGKITAHNLWMKILNFQKDEEKMESEEKKRGAVPEFGRGKTSGNFNPMASLLSQLGSDSEPSSDKNHQHIKSNSSSAFGSSSGSSSTHVKSSMATKYQKKSANAVTNMLSPDNHWDQDSDVINPQNLQSLSDAIQNSEEGSSHSMNGQDNPNTPVSSSVGGQFNPNELNSLMNGGFMDSVDSSFAGDASLDNHIKTSKQDGSDDLSSVDKKNPVMERENPLASVNNDSFDNEKDINGRATMPSAQEDVDNQFAQLLNNKKEKEKKKKDQKTNESSLGQVSSSGLGQGSSSKDKKPRPDKDQKVEKTSKKKDGGLKKEKDKKDGKILSREEKRKEFERQVSILEDACNIALPECFPVEPLEESRPFEIESLAVFSINQPSFKGYILFANSFNHKEDRGQTAEMESIISDHLDKNGMMGGIGNFFEFSVPSVEYTKWAEETCEFTIQYEDDSGKQFFLSFLPREKVLPQYSDADLNKDMIRVDLQHIPPNTPVDFDAFIHLPLNKRYVRYLKKERSISLEQAKRLLKDSEHKRLFVQKSEKQKFIQFYIKNAIYWEIMCYIKQLKAS